MYQDHPFNMERLPTWCSKFCKNSLSDVCVEDCAVTRKMTNFKIKPDYDLPPYPLGDFEDMTKEEKGFSLAIYVAKLTEGNNEYNNEIRQNNDDTGSSRVPKNIKVKNLLFGESEKDTAHKDSA